jgi:hypothetical protein
MALPNSTYRPYDSKRWSHLSFSDMSGVLKALALLFSM